jgi:hypothetical protein
MRTSARTPAGTLTLTDDPLKDRGNRGLIR